MWTLRLLVSEIVAVEGLKDGSEQVQPPTSFFLYSSEKTHRIRGDHRRYIFGDMKTLLSAISMAVFSQFLSAQVPLDSAANAPRSGDELCKLKISFVYEGDAGRNQVWRLGEANKKSRQVRQRITASGDTIALFEAGRIRHFLMHGNTLTDKGEQSRRAYMLYDDLLPMLRYPFALGDSISGKFSGVGREENVDAARTGFGYTVADGFGILTDGLDTLRNVTRLHFRDDFTDTYFGADTTRFRTVIDRYAWFCTGYRYPVQESLRWFEADGDSLIPTDSTTYLYLPEMQLEDLADDVVNDSIRTLLATVAAGASATNGQISALRDLQAGISADGSRLDLHFTVTEACDLTFIACDVMGNVLGSAHYANCAAGDWQESITLSRQAVGNALMLKVQSGEERQNMKVYQ